MRGNERTVYQDSLRCSVKADPISIITGIDDTQIYFKNMPDATNNDTWRLVVASPDVLSTISITITKDEANVRQVKTVSLADATLANVQKLRAVGNYAYIVGRNQDITSVHLKSELAGSNYEVQRLKLEHDYSVVLIVSNQYSTPPSVHKFGWCHQNLCGL